MILRLPALTAGSVCCMIAVGLAGCGGDNGTSNAVPILTPANTALTPASFTAQQAGNQFAYTVNDNGSAATESQTTGPSVVTGGFTTFPTSTQHTINGVTTTTSAFRTFDANGNLVEVEADTFNADGTKKAVFTYSSPLIIMPSGLLPGQSVTQTVTRTQTDVATGAVTTDTVTRQITFIGYVPSVVTPAGTFSNVAKLQTLVTVINSSGAVASTTTTTSEFAPGVGLIASTSTTNNSAGTSTSNFQLSSATVNGVSVR